MLCNLSTSTVLTKKPTTQRQKASQSIYQRQRETERRERGRRERRREERERELTSSQLDLIAIEGEMRQPERIAGECLVQVLESRWSSGKNNVLRRNDAQEEGQQDRFHCYLKDQSLQRGVFFESSTDIQHTFGEWVRRGNGWRVKRTILSDWILAQIQSRNGFVFD
jgi:hypothetical protein